MIKAKNKEQQEYIRSIIENQITFCFGCAGSGKSFISLGIACEHLLAGKTRKLIVLRPLVCVGKFIGTFPGHVMEKIDPYFLPVQVLLKEFLGGEQYYKFLKDKKIEFYPLELIRGLTFSDSYVCLDEAQSADYSQLKALITRMGPNCKYIINGDLKQSDLFKDKTDVEKIWRVLKDIEGINLVELEVCERNPFLRKIIETLNNYEM